MPATLGSRCTTQRTTRCSPSIRPIDRFTDLRYITTATGRDYRDVAPTSGTYASLGARGTLSVRKTIRIATLDGA